MMVTLTELNQMAQREFVQILGEIYEHTPQIAAQTWYQRPFKDRLILHQRMVRVVEEMGEKEQMNLICAHPDLGSKAEMAESSVQEQAGVGLNRLSPSDYEKFQQLNQAYQDKFGFPFIVAVKNHTQETILAAFADRLQNSIDEEKQEALRQIHQIAWFRLEKLIQESAY